MTPASYYADLDRLYRICQEKALEEPCSIPKPLLEGLSKIMVVAVEIIQRSPDSFARKGDIVFLAMAYPILASIAAGELVELSSVEGCIRAYTDSSGDKPMDQSRPQAKETQYCKLRGGPCNHCVDMYRNCRNYYEVA